MHGTVTSAVVPDYYVMCCTVTSWL